MSQDKAFEGLIERVRAGDEAAAAELVRTFEPQIQRMVRVRLSDRALRRQMDSMDICQSVFADFFVRAALGQFDLDSPSQLVSLLASIARNRLIDHARKQKAARRDLRRVESADVGDLAIVHSQDSPSQVVSNQEMLERFRSQLSDEERLLASERCAGRPWDEIAASRGRTAEAVRKQYERAIDRVAGELGIRDDVRD
jgi:RNA polymerase sigma factor (sigma-70 family)